mgnify:CR=1 FL=1
MEFQIDFNRENIENEDKFFKHIGAYPFESEDEHFGYYVEINTFEELEELSNKINLYLTDGKNTYTYSLILNFDPSCIYIDKDV